jgi:hypothetical protein
MIWPVRKYRNKDWRISKEPIGNGVKNMVLKNKSTIDLNIILMRLNVCVRINYSWNIYEKDLIFG